MPWSLCTHSWNSRFCSERMRIGNNTDEKVIYLTEINELFSLNESLTNMTRISSAAEYYNIYMLGINRSTGLNNLGHIKIDVFVCLISIFVLMYFCIYRGVKGTGKLS